MIIRDIIEDDFENLYNFISTFPITFGYDKETIRNFFNDPDIVGYVAEVDGQPKAVLVGTIVTPIFNNKIKVGWIFGIYGNAHSIALIKKFKSYIKSLGLTYLTICTDTNSPPSLNNIYVKLGFKRLQTMYCGEI